MTNTMERTWYGVMTYSDDGGKTMKQLTYKERAELEDEYMANKKEQRKEIVDKPVNKSDVLNAHTAETSGEGTTAGSSTGQAAPSNPDKTPDDSGVSE